MQKNQKLLFIGLGLAAALIGAAVAGGFFKSENALLHQAASVVAPNNGSAASSASAKPLQPGATDGGQSAPTGPATTIQYDNDNFDFGVVDEGQIVKHTFKFKNTGSEPLVISNARASCGCTVPSWPKEAIAPGAEAKIDVSFDTNGKPGKQSKRVTVIANTNPTETFLTIQGEVRGKQQPQTVKGH